MNTQKKQLIGDAAGKAAAACSSQAKKASGWQRVLWGIGAAIAAAIAWFAGGSAQVQPAVEQQTENASPEP